MKRSAGVVLAVIILALIGTAALMAGRFERRMAIAQEDMAVLDFVDPQADYAALQEDITGLPLVSERPLREIQRRRAMLQYWQADYADLVEVARTANEAEDADSIDPEMRVLAANALYRVAQRGPQDRPTLL